MSEQDHKDEGFLDDNGNPRAPTMTDVLAAIKELSDDVRYLTGLVDQGGCLYGSDHY